MAFIKGFQSVSSTPLTILFPFYRRTERFAAAARRAGFFRLGATDFTAFFAAFGLETALSLGLALTRAGMAGLRALPDAFRGAFVAAFVRPLIGALALSRIRSIVFATLSIEAMPSRLESRPFRA
jgi:hypothetical protein